MTTATPELAWRLAAQPADIYAAWRASDLGRDIDSLELVIGFAAVATFPFLGDRIAGDVVDLQGRTNDDLADVYGAICIAAHNADWDGVSALTDPLGFFEREELATLAHGLAYASITTKWGTE